MTSDGSLSDGTFSPNAPNLTILSNTQAIFNANWRASSDTAITTVSGNADGHGTIIYKSGPEVDANVKVSGVFTPSFLSLLGYLGVPGVKQIKLSATANAADNIPAYMTFYMLLDNTPSMGIAATSAGITTMVNNTPDQCAFACHDLSNSNNYYNLASKLGVATRISNVAQATSNLLTTAQSTENTNGISNEFNVAIYDFGTASSDPTSSSYAGFNQIYPSSFGSTTTDLSSAGTAASKIDLMTVNGQGQYNDEDTNINLPLAYAAKNIVASGNGTSANSPQQVIFLVSDGAIDTYDCGTNPTTGKQYDADTPCRRITPIDTTSCSTLKSHGVEIAVLYTTYLPLPTNTFWQQWIGSLQGWLAPWTNPPPASQDQIANNMQACATTGLYFEVNSNQDINAAMQALFRKVLASVRITS